MTARPSWCTRPDPNAAHDLAAIRRVAHMLGTPLMPWQQLAARIASERRPDGSWRYKTVIVTVPRQSGKTTLLRAVMTQRAMTTPDWLGFYSAQTGKDAMARWKDLVAQVDQLPTLRPYVTTRLAAGSPALTFQKTRSSISPFAPTPTSLHGYTPPFVSLDEAFSFSEDEGAALMGAIMPAQATIAARQLWLISTKGDATATWFAKWVETGRAATEDPNSTIAHIEYCAPDGADLYDPATWALYHPALGHTITTEDLQDIALHCPPGEWARAFGNVTTLGREAMIDLLAWDDLTDDELPRIPDTGTIGIGVDVHHDRSHASIWAAWIDQDDIAHLAVIASAPGIDWVRDRLDVIRALLGERAQLGAPDDGPVRQITDDLVRDQVKVATIGGRDFATACGAILWRANVGLLTHDGTPSLRDAWAAAAHRPLGDGWATSRHLSAGPIDALNAAAVAIRLAQLQPAPVNPEMRFA